MTQDFPCILGYSPGWEELGNRQLRGNPEIRLETQFSLGCTSDSWETEIQGQGAVLKVLSGGKALKSLNLEAEDSIEFLSQAIDSSQEEGWSWRLGMNGQQQMAWGEALAVLMSGVKLVLPPNGLKAAETIHFLIQGIEWVSVCVCVCVCVCARARAHARMPTVV